MEKIVSMVQYPVMYINCNEHVTFGLFSYKPIPKTFKFYDNILYKYCLILNVIAYFPPSLLVLLKTMKCISQKSKQ